MLIVARYEFDFWISSFSPLWASRLKFSRFLDGLWFSSSWLHREDASFQKYTLGLLSFIHVNWRTCSPSHVPTLTHLSAYPEFETLPWANWREIVGNRAAEMQTHWLLSNICFSGYAPYYYWILGDVIGC